VGWVKSSTEKNPTGRWRAYSYEELIQRDETNLSLFWIPDESVTDSDNLPDPDALTGESIEDLRAALEQYEAVMADLGSA
jgi:type I restriction enzyme M protein